MADQKFLGRDGSQAEPLDAIREIVLGPVWRDLDRRLQELTRQVERLGAQQAQWRAEQEMKLTQLQARLDRMSRRLLRQRHHLKRTLAAFEAEWQRMQSRVRWERSRLKLAELLTQLTPHLRPGGTPANDIKSSPTAAARSRRPAGNSRQKNSSAGRRSRKSP
ncbi:MAG: hypothetical protein ONB48_12245 [candidate division KSB1 bacterium]|nr:hypothetical protein [candidate division KSB1 bacterium]MDZ7274043.1 hypothetical protein [candidate division KSB1 bacterium]MDZ7286416.1 hypothetical protein [candidate division KSB1 bacterium]MDZ7296644.1 hypothetical protein [candidate division KSB1 bacterium]MDZ7306866.1 hypothetical protein [candidate division KSB1 bacterium]